jgi:uncharacterized protein affecting Mg2+/Co2+ transport
VIPAEIADEIAAEAAEMTVFEDFVLEEVQNGRGDHQHRHHGGGADGRDDAVGRIPAQRPVFCRQAAKVFEDFVLEEVQNGRGVIGLYPLIDERAKADFAAWRQKTTPSASPTTTSPGNTATSPQPIGTLMSSAWCRVRLEVQNGRGVIGLYPLIDERAKADFAAWRQKTGR